MPPSTNTETSQHGNPIFSREQRAQLQDDLRELHDVLPMISDAEQCGVECSVFREVVSELRKQLEMIETKFMQKITE